MLNDLKKVYRKTFDGNEVARCAGLLLSMKNKLFIDLYCVLC